MTRSRATRFVAVSVVSAVSAVGAVSLVTALGVAANAASPSQQPGRTTNDGVYTAEQATRGQTMYQAQCASCHGATLAGAEAAPALTGSGFGVSWTEVPVGDLFERIRLSMPLDKPGTLGRQQTADIVAYILSVNKAPAGQIELPGDADVLKAIRIVSAP